MCGIAGIVDFASPVELELLEEMCADMVHRGPSSRGVHLEDGVALGIQRLAIIDVQGGDQPIRNEDGSVVVVLNGEIYNHEQLREELQRAGHRFRSHSDTEVIVHLYEEHGRDLVHRLRGMFAFAVWDARRRRLLIGRDRVGKKPLFWTQDGSRLAFASEIRTLLRDPRVSREIDPVAIGAFLALQYIPHPLSALRNVHKLPPACTLEWEGRSVEIKPYWQLEYEPKTEASEPELREQLLRELEEATRIRLMSEVPLGAFLSGGIDSSAVVAMMAKHMPEPVKTFSIGFPHEDYDEVRYARMVAERFGTEHHEFQVEPEALEIMPKLARHYGEPFGDPSAIPSFYLAELTARHVTVALNGDGGDECFAGYGRYVRNHLVGRLDWLPRPLQVAAPALARLLPPGRRERSPGARARRLAAALAAPPWQRYATGMSAWTPERLGALLTPEFAAALSPARAQQAIADAWQASRTRNPIDTMLDVDVNTYLPGDLLVKIDIATMAYSLEARSPFLDQQLMQFAASLPAPLKLDGGAGKRLLRDALRGLLPDEVLDRKKMGFGVPLEHWFRNELRELPAERLLDPGALARAYFRPNAIQRTIDEHQQGIADHSMRLWLLLQLEGWHREVLKAPAGPLIGSGRSQA